MYTKEQNEEIEKVCRVFDSYIRETGLHLFKWNRSRQRRCLHGTVNSQDW